ncbi:MAG: hypothetical protein EXR67_06755 [Dehalococcoidia bacterium]|nr:hypothetical protein [Dehalococcoidia bacterium]
MPETASFDVLGDLAIIMMVAGFTTLLFHWLRLPITLGYLIAGVIVGPFTPPFFLVHDVGLTEALADLGIVLLMFTIGLEFSLKKLRRVGQVAIIGGAIEVLITSVDVLERLGTDSSLRCGSAPE